MREVPAPRWPCWMRLTRPRGSAWPASIANSASGRSITRRCGVSEQKPSRDRLAVEFEQDARPSGIAGDPHFLRDKPRLLLGNCRCAEENSHGGNRKTGDHTRKAAPRRTAGHRLAANWALEGHAGFHPIDAIRFSYQCLTPRLPWLIKTLTFGIGATPEGHYLNQGCHALRQIIKARQGPLQCMQV